MARDPGDRGEELASEVNTQLNWEFEDGAAYREAVEAVVSYFKVVLDALDEDDKGGYGHGV
jgi:hypothetical protein